MIRVLASISISGLVLTVLSMSPASAVETARCPVEMVLTYESLSTFKTKEIVANANRTVISPEDALASARKLSDINYFEYQEVSMKLTKKKDGKCHYLPVGYKGKDPSSETRLYTVDGRDLLRVSLQTGGENFWIYHTVESYSPGKMQLADISGHVMGTEDHGAPRVRMGYADDLAIDIDEAR